MGFIRFLVFATVLVGLLVLLIVPLVAAPMLANMVRQMGVHADDVTVSVQPFDPALFSGRSGATRVTADNVALAPVVVEHLDVTFGGVSFLDGSFETVRGDLVGVEIAAEGLSVTVSSVEVSGPANAASAIGQLSATDTERLILAAAARVGLPVDAVRLSSDGLVIAAGGLEVPARVAVRTGALVMEPQLGPSVLLLKAAPDDLWRLTEAWMTPSGLAVRGMFDAEQFVGGLPGTP